MQTFREWISEKEEIESRRLISFHSFFKDETSQLNESVIHKIKKIFLAKDADYLVKQFKEIFNIQEEIIYNKVSIGGGTNITTGHIKYSSLGTLIHELIHYLQFKSGCTEKNYIVPIHTDCGILEYILQPRELNNWAISLACEALQYNSFEEFLKNSKELPKSKTFEDANKAERMKHCIYLLQSDIRCGKHTPVKYEFKEKLFKLSKQYMLAIKSLEKDISECYIEEIIDLI
jgi:hypothetical protein